MELPVKPVRIWSFFTKFKYGTLLVKDAKKEVICKCWTRENQQKIIQALNAQHQYKPGKLSDKLRRLADVFDKEWFFGVDSQDPSPSLNEIADYLDKLEKNQNLKK